MDNTTKEKLILALMKLTEIRMHGTSIKSTDNFSMSFQISGLLYETGISSRQKLKTALEEIIKDSKGAIKNPDLEKLETENNDSSINYDMVYLTFKLEELRQLHKEVLDDIDTNNTSTYSEVLFLNQHGELYKQNKTHVYGLRGASMRIAILKNLRKNFTTTEDLMRAVDCNNPDSFRATIGDMNAKAKKHLELKEKLIKAIPSRGYRINDPYTIRMVTE